jgi:hypothetical protein
VTVVGDDISVSVSVHTESDEVRASLLAQFLIRLITYDRDTTQVGLRDALMQHPIPIEKEWPVDVRIKALAHYLHLVTTDPAINLTYAGVPSGEYHHQAESQQGTDVGERRDGQPLHQSGNQFIEQLVKTRYSHFALDPWVDGLAARVDDAEKSWREVERWELGREDGEDLTLCVESEEVRLGAYVAELCLLTLSLVRSRSSSVSISSALRTI